jgi:Domain of unknown function (DUF4375)
MDGWAKYEELVALDRVSLTQDQRNLVAFGDLRTELNNGGFDQYFFNSGGDFAPELLVVADSLQLPSLADLITRAIAVFGHYPTERFVRQERLLEVAPDGDAFEALDQEYYALEAAMDMDSTMNTLASRI